MGAEYVERLQSVTEALELLGLEVGCISDLVFRPCLNFRCQRGGVSCCTLLNPRLGYHLVVVWDIVAESLSLRPSAYFLCFLLLALSDCDGDTRT